MFSRKQMSLEILFFPVLILYNTIFYVKDNDGHDFFKNHLKVRKTTKKGMKGIGWSFFGIVPEYIN